MKRGLVLEVPRLELVSGDGFRGGAAIEAVLARE
jgi:hypothetical protein